MSFDFDERNWRAGPARPPPLFRNTNNSQRTDLRGARAPGVHRGAGTGTGSLRDGRNGGSRPDLRTCYNCQQAGHLAKDCKNSKTGQSRTTNGRATLRSGSTPAGGTVTGTTHVTAAASTATADNGSTCHNCQKTGHLLRDCPDEPKSKTRGVPPNTRPTFGFKRLSLFLTSDDADSVIMAIGRNIPEWVKLFDSSPTTSHSADFFPLILHILAQKVCHQGTVLQTNQNSILMETFGDNFTKQLQNLYITMSMGVMTSRSNTNGITIDTSSTGILQSVYTIFAFVHLRCPSTTRDYVVPLILGAIGILSTMSIMRRDSAFDELLANFTKLMETINSDQKKAKEEAVRKKFNKYEISEMEEKELHDMTPPDDFRDIPIIPTIQEILSTEEPFLRTNKKTGSYIDADHYLDVQFRLLREDFVQPLKKGIQDFIKNRTDYLSKKKKLPIGSVRIYPDTRIKNVALIGDALTYNIQLPVSMFGKIKWEKSKRLLNGSLLVFTHDNFKSAYFGIVARRDIPQLKQGILGITWEGDPPDFDKTFLMVECEVYFEAYRHTLGILKTIELGKFPLAKFIVEASDAVCAPKYVEETTHQMSLGGHYISPLVGPWPSANRLGFDDNQFLAFQAALTKEFSIIQGPPGTGKTYLGLKVAETFLTNLNYWWGAGKGPILVVCYTNHALDQFLEGILRILKVLNPKEEPALIRVGGRSKCEVLDQFSLHKKRITARRMRTFNSGFREAEYEAVSSVRELESERSAIIGEAVGFGNLEGLVNIDAYAEKLKGVISENVLSVMKKPEWFGLNDNTFRTASFAPHELIQTWFKATARAKAPPAQPIRQQAGAAETPESEDDEDYDLDELLANRVDDEEIEFEMSNLQASGENIKYVNMCSVSKCQQAIAKARHAMGGLGDPAKKLNPTLQAQEMRRLAAEIHVTENKMKFLELLMHSQKEGLLQLPDMTDFTGPENSLSVKDLNTLSLAQKWSLYFAVMDKARILAVQATAKVSDSLVMAQKKLDSIRRAGDGQILQKTKVVGMTTTGAAKNHDLLQMMQSKIVIVEEAAEVLESHIVTCITEHCQQLILIGDHQQLRPSTTVYDLSKKYYLDISLFERMLNNNLNCYRLKVQHRMRPEIANLVVGTIYSELNNHPTVEDYPDVKGMDRNLFFIDHQQHEKSENDSMSKSNEYEAKFLAGLCRHLILQGYEPSEITVLTTYTGQMFLLKKEISNLDSCRGVRVTVVDNYQGEENTIILLSLVRSNEQNNIGFLKTDNRICVAISRAKHGLYICGNMSNLTASSKTWKQIRGKLTERREVGRELKLVCEIHGTITPVSSPNDFRTKSPEGGCGVLCKTVLNCTHECESICHINDREHAHYKCRKPCLKLCGNNHSCREKCFVKCPPCNVKMEKTLPCEHVLAMPCHRDPTQVNCLVLVDKKKPCGHMEKMTCFTNPASIRCREVVPKTLTCGHVKEAECHVDPGLITCKVQVTKVLIPCGHEQVVLCHMHPEMISCETDVEKEFEACKHKVTVKCKDSKKSVLYCKVPCSNRLGCGHQCTKICHVLEDPHHVDYKCMKECARECENGHPCRTKHKCSAECPPCKIKMEKVLSCLTHTSVVECMVPTGSILCKARCEQRLAFCNHKCTKKCYEECIPCQTSVLKRSLCGHNQLVKCSEQPSQARCEERVRSKEFSACHHEVLVPCKLKDTITSTKIVDYCDSPCGYLFQDNNPKGCQHRCKGTCAECLQGRLHKKCQEECGRVLVCGHVCSFPCSSVCPPCQKECFMKCEHSACQAICGAPCTDCKEKCSWKCVHKACTKLCSEDCDRGPCDQPCNKTLKCGHPCIGFCGEPCPPLCRVCDKEKLTEFILYGYEEDEDARFVYLEDCKHSIEAEGLTFHMESEVEEGEIGAKACPRCKTIIRHCKRYGNILRKRLVDVMNVKIMAFGNQEVIQPKQKELVSEILEISGKAEWIQVLSQTNPHMKDYFLEKLAYTLPPNPRLPPGRPQVKLCKVPGGTFRSLEWIARQAKDVVHLYKTSETLLRLHDFNSLRRKYGRLFQQLLSRALPLTKTEMENFENEFDRHYDICELYKRKGSANFTNGHSIAEPLYKRATNLVRSLRPYTKSTKEQLHTILKEIDNSLKTGLGISERERQEILAALDMAPGRWFKCPNGHIYVITECGGAMEVSKCNECGAAIGGGSHRVLADNQLASEMDGATAPLYPQ